MGNGYGQVAPTDLDAIRLRLQSISDRLAEIERPTGTQRSAIVADLRARDTFSVNNSFNQSYSGLLGDTSTGLSVSLSLSESRKVLVIGSVTLTLNSSGASSVQGSYSAVVDGTSGIIATGSISGTSNLSVPLWGIRSFTLAAGSHTIAANVSGNASGTASGQFVIPYLTVMVLQAV